MNRLKLPLTKTMTNTKCLKDPTYAIFSKPVKDIKYEILISHHHHHIDYLVRSPKHVICKVIIFIGGKINGDDDRRQPTNRVNIEQSTESGRWNDKEIANCESKMFYSWAFLRNEPLGG